MKDTQILFTAPMVRATLADQKTHTRRIAKGLTLDWLQQGFTPEYIASPENSLSPYGFAGDRLWGRETFFAWGRWETRFSAKKGRDEWHFIDLTLESGRDYLYAADGNELARPGKREPRGAAPTWWKRPAIFMPRAASRLPLEVTGVRLERLQDISEADALAEGIEHFVPDDPRKEYRLLWEDINGAGSWAANPWVWVVAFARVPLRSGISHLPPQGGIPAQQGA